MFPRVAFVPGFRKQRIELVTDLLHISHLWRRDKYLIIIVRNNGTMNKEVGMVTYLKREDVYFSFSTW
jgi:hypothetical protein